MGSGASRSAGVAMPQRLASASARAAEAFDDMGDPVVGRGERRAGDPGVPDAGLTADDDSGFVIAASRRRRSFERPMRGHATGTRPT
jgi:hypothetical protein